MSAPLSDSTAGHVDEERQAAAIEGVAPPRHVLVERAWPGLQMRWCREDIRRASQWSIHSRQTVVVHLGGQMQSLQTRIEGFGVRDRVARPGEVWLVPSQRQYRGQALGGKIAYAELELADAIVMDVPGQRSDRPGEFAACLGRRDDFLGVAVRQLGRLLRAGDDLSLLLADSLQATLRLHLLRGYRRSGADIAAGSTSTATIGDAVARRLLDHVEAKLDQRIVLAELAAVAGIPEHRLVSGFRQRFGTTPAQFVMDRRVERAMRMLRQSHHGIADIALATGFSSHSHFTAVFRSRTGQTPQQFRRAR